MKKMVCLFLLLSQVSFADDTNTVLQKGQPAPYTGVLLTPASAEKQDTIKYGLDSCTKISALKDQENALITQRIDNANAEVQKLSTQINKQEDTSFWKSVGFFALGVGVTGLISYGLVKTLK